MSSSTQFSTVSIAFDAAGLSLAEKQQRFMNALIQSFESREQINVKVYPHFEFKFIMQHVHTFHAYLVQSLLRNAV